MEGFQCRCCLALVLLCVVTVWAQDTLGQSGCTFFDKNYMYKIEMTRGAHDHPCTSVDTIQEEFKTSEKRVLELSYDLMQLQAMVLRLMEKNENLTKKVEELTKDLKVTKEALQTHNVAMVDCPEGYTLRSDEFKSCYMFVARSLAWYDAQTFCDSTGGFLVAVETLEEQNFLVDYVKTSSVLPGNHMWTGGNDIAKEDEWIWVGVNLPFNQTQWLLYPHKQRGEVQMPDNHQGQEHCVHLFHLHDYEWNDIYCGYEYYFACEFKLI